MSERPALDFEMLAAPAVPALLASVHERLQVDDEVDLGLPEVIDPAGARDIIVGAGFEYSDRRHRTDARSRWFRCRRIRSLPDHVAPGMRLLVCGLNPSEYAADAGVGYARPGNRFWPAALRAGVVSDDRDWRAALFGDEVGFTDLVKRATPGADALVAADYVEGAARVARLVEIMRPRALVFVGLTGYRAAVAPNARPGVQSQAFAGAAAYLMPSTSGRNAHATLDDLTEHLRAAADLARSREQLRHGRES